MNIAVSLLIFVPHTKFSHPLVLGSYPKRRCR